MSHERRTASIRAQTGLALLALSLAGCELPSPTALTDGSFTPIDTGADPVIEYERPYPIAVHFLDEPWPELREAVHNAARRWGRAVAPTPNVATPLPSSASSGCSICGFVEGGKEVDISKLQYRGISIGNAASLPGKHLTHVMGAGDPMDGMNVYVGIRQVQPEVKPWVHGGSCDIRDERWLFDPESPGYGTTFAMVIMVDVDENGTDYYPHWQQARPTTVTDLENVMLATIGQGMSRLERRRKDVMEQRGTTSVYVGDAGISALERATGKDWPHDHLPLGNIGMWHECIGVVADSDRGAHIADALADTWPNLDNPNGVPTIKVITELALSELPGFTYRQSGIEGDLAHEVYWHSCPTPSASSHAGERTLVVREWNGRVVP